MSTSTEQIVAEFSAIQSRLAVAERDYQRSIDNIIDACEKAVLLSIDANPEELGPGEVDEEKLRKWIETSDSESLQRWVDGLRTVLQEIQAELDTATTEYENALDEITEALESGA